MIQTIGLIIGVYALARMAQIPLAEAHDFGKPSLGVCLISIICGGIIALLLASLLYTDVPQFPRM